MLRKQVKGKIKVYVFKVFKLSITDHSFYSTEKEYQSLPS